MGKKSKCLLSFLVTTSALLCSGGSGAQDNASTSAAWRLPEAHWVPAKMPLTVIYPRPDNETNKWARHRRAYPGIEYRIPIAVQGGAYPFKYEILKGPVGMRVGADWRSDDAGIITWTPATEGTYMVRVGVTDQQLTHVTAEFTVTVTTNGFLFLDPRGPTDGDGTIDRPFRSFSSIHRDDYRDDTFRGYILYLRGGTHILTGPLNSNGNFRIDKNAKPTAWLGYPGENAIVNAEKAIVTFSQGTSDVFMQGFRMTDSREDVANSRFFFFGGVSGDRTTFFDMRFDHLRRGLKGNDNPGAIVMFASDRYRRYLTVQDCRLTDYQAPLFDVYTTQYAVADSNLLGVGQGGLVDQGLFAKANNDRWSIRRNVSVSQDFRYGAIEQMMHDRGLGPQRLEIAYNLVVTKSPAARAVVYNWTTTKSTDNEVWIYRNTLVGNITGLAKGTQYHITLENNIIVTDGNPPVEQDADGKRVTLSGNLLATAQSTPLNATHELSNDYRKLVGIVGHVLSP